MTGLGSRMMKLNVIMSILTCHPERSEGSFAKESCKDSSLTLRMTGNYIILTIKDLHKVLAGQGIASKIRKLLKHKDLHPLHKNTK